MLSGMLPLDDRKFICDNNPSKSWLTQLGEENVDILYFDLIFDCEVKEFLWRDLLRENVHKGLFYYVLAGFHAISTSYMVANRFAIVNLHGFVVI